LFWLRDKYERVFEVLVFQYDNLVILGGGTEGSTGREGFVENRKSDGVLIGIAAGLRRNL
jgi:hypothetical protein